MYQGAIYFHPIFVFFVGCIFFYIMPMFYFEQFEFIYWGIFIIAVISYGFGYYCSNIATPYSERSPKPIILNLIPYVAVIACLYLIWTVATHESIGNYATLFQYESQGALYLQIFKKLNSMVALLLSSYYASKSRKHYFLISLCFIIILSMSDTRFHLIGTLIYWAGFGVYFQYIKIRFLMVLASFLISPFIFSLLLLKRGISFEKGDTFSSYYDLITSINITELFELAMVSMETFVSFNTFTKVLENDFIHPESGVIRLFFLFIPRTIWLDKPESISRIVAGEFYPGAYLSGGGM